MKKVDVIFNGSIKTTIGPAGTLKRIIKNQTYFKECGFDISVFSLDTINESSGINGQENKEFRKIQSNRIKKYIKSSLHKSFILSALYEYFLINRPKKQLKQYFQLNRNPDVVVFHSLFPCYQFLKKNKNKNIKTVLFQHSDGIPFKMDFIYYPKLKNTWFENWLMKKYRFVINKIDKLVFISRNGQNNFLQNNPAFNINKTFLLVNGIEDLSDEEKQNLNSLKRKNNFKYNLVCTGTISNRKGQSIIIEAMNKINKNILKNIHLTLIGDGPEKLKLQKFVKNNSLTANVTFAGNIPNADVYRYLAVSDIYILMSKNEGLPISIIEAMRSSLPVITTNNSGMPEVVKHDYNGYLLEADVNQLVGILNNIDNYNWIKMGTNSRTKFELEFTFTRMKKEYCEMIDSIE